MPSCRYAMMTDKYHGWECTLIGNACLFFNPDFGCCQKEYGNDISEKSQGINFDKAFEPLFNKEGVDDAEIR